MRVSVTLEIICASVLERCAPPAERGIRRSVDVRCNRVKRRNRPRRQAFVARGKGEPMQTVDPNKTTTEVRQADRKRGTLWVLIVSIVVIFLVFAGLWWWYTLSTPPSAG
jgi:hypothetical protein